MTCFEDDPCWDWRTMGDRMAGGAFSGLNVDQIVRAFETAYGYSYAL